MQTILLSLPSPIEEIFVDGQSFYLKRDDLIHPDFSGNKARKFYYYLVNDFPKVKKIVSYGSSQSNAMYSLSVLAKMKGWEFDYYVDHISEYLRENPQGNYGAAMENGMRVRMSTPRAFVPSVGHAERLAPQGHLSLRSGTLSVEKEESVLFVEEGGRQKEAEVGIQLLAEEIMVWQKEQKIKDLNIFLPSGTGTTALFLQKALSTCPTEGTNTLGVFKVFTMPCAGDAAYLKKQFLQLESDEDLHPTILNLDKKYHFGKLYRDSYKIWLKLREQTGVEFDLLYDPKGWMTMMKFPEIFSEPTLYIHQGGLIGNESMLPRYRRKYPSLSM